VLALWPHSHLLCDQALLPPSSTDLEVAPWVQIASLIGVGLLYQGTADRHMVEVLLKEIGKVPCIQPLLHRRSCTATVALTPLSVLISLAAWRRPSHGP
jgi:hypothetical protein